MHETHPRKRRRGYNVNALLSKPTLSWIAQVQQFSAILAICSHTFSHLVFISVIAILVITIQILNEEIIFVKFYINTQDIKQL